MSFKEFDRSKVRQFPLRERKNKVDIEKIYVKPEDPDPEITKTEADTIHRIAEYIIEARKNGKSVMLAFGAHSIKNGLGLLMVEYLKHDWITHLATNGAGIIHDWEFAYQGKSSESVAENLPVGKFGTWEETGFSLNMAIIAGVYQGLGYGASVGKAIEDGGIMIPSEEELLGAMHDQNDLEKAASAADFIGAIRKAGLKPGWYEIPAPDAAYSLQAGAYRLGVASTDHPMFGHDIIYTHYLNSGDAIGRAAERDFLSFVNSLSNLDGGVYLSLGSAIMSPMVFEKAYSMVQNVKMQHGESLDGHHIAVVDLASPKWDWSQGEPPKSNPEYYASYMRIFKRSKPAAMDYLTIDNRVFLLSLYHELLKLQEYGK